MKQIQEIIAQGENQTIEFKSSFQKEVIETVVAFANTKGGKIFNNSITIFNPGKLYDDLTIEKLQSGNYSSRTRNRAIARAFKEAGIIERYGSGIARIKDECKRHGILEPKFEEFAHGFRVTLFKEKLPDGINDLYEFIEKNQPIRISHIKEYFNQISTRTLERWIKKLKDENKIEFVGSKKTGGYVIKDNDDT